MIGMQENKITRVPLMEAVKKVASFLLNVPMTLTTSIDAGRS